jgi:hypothetical protein
VLLPNPQILKEEKMILLYQNIDWIITSIAIKERCNEMYQPIGQGIEAD